MTISSHASVSDKSYNAIKRAPSDFACLMSLLRIARDLSLELKMDELVIDLSFIVADIEYAVNAREQKAA
jgi:hypothetical protein